VRDAVPSKSSYRWHPVGGLLAVLAGVAVIAGTFLGLLSVSVNGVRSPTVTVWGAGNTMKMPAVVVKQTDEGRRASVSSTRTTSARLQAPGVSLFSLDPSPGQDRWILLAAGVIAVVVGSTAILRSRLIWRLVLLLDGALVGVLAARYLVGVARNVVPGYRGPPDLTLRLSFSTHVESGMVLLFAASGVLVVAAVCTAFAKRPGSLGTERSATTAS
jgi:energy-converting hydrogenase Eha subunit C